MCLMCNPADIGRFMKAGNATFTISSRATGARYTYNVWQIENKNNKDKKYDKWIVKLLTGPDNISNYTYIGMINNEPNADGSDKRMDEFVTTTKSKLTMDSKPVRAFVFLCQKVLQKNQTPDSLGLEFRHMGKCGRCKRPLTVPSSIDIGIGPECQRQMGL